MRSMMLVELDIYEQDKVSSCWHCAVLVATPGRHIELSIRNVCDP